MKMNRREFSGLFSAAMVGATAKPSPVPSMQRWNILMITDDQHRADCLGCMGNSVIKTPNIDRLASQGAMFTSHYVQAPQCVPSRSALYTGRYPHVNLTPSNRFHLSPKEHTLATVLNANGYQTAAVGELPFAPTKYLAGIQKVIASPPDHEAFLADHGWAGGNIPEQHRRLLQAKQAEASKYFQAAPDPWPAELDETAFYAGKAIDYLKQSSGKPFFLHINFRRPHHPFDPPIPYDRMYSDAVFPPSVKKEGEMANKPPQQHRALRDTVGFDLRTMTDADLHRVKSYYYGMISLNDHYIGTVLDYLESSGLADSTIVVFNADHGEMLGDHGLLFKGAYFYEGLVRVPLIIRAPGKVRPGTKVDALVQEIDLMPTLLDMIGVTVPAGVQGQSLSPLTKAEGKGRDAVYSEFPTIKMVRTADWKLVHYVGARYGELYDLQNDPNELTNLYFEPGAAGARAEIEVRLSDWLIKSADPLLKPIPAEQS